MLFGRGFKLGTIGGITIRVDYSWFIIFGLLVFLLASQFPYLPSVSKYHIAPIWYWVVAVLTAVLFFASVLGHELSHAVVARKNGIPINNITLFLLGGAAQMEDEPPTAWDEFKMAIVGPIASIIIGLFFFGLVWITRGFGSILLVYAFGYLGIINIVLAVFNLLPGFPMDGGRVFRAILWGATGNLVRATQIASITGQAFGLAFIAFGVLSVFYPPLRGYISNGLWLALIGWFLFSAARSSYQQVVIREALRHIPVENIMNPSVIMVPANISVDHLVTEYFLRESPSTLPVEQNGELLGTVNVDDVRAVPREQWGTTLVSEIVHPMQEAQVLHPENDAWDAANRLSQSTDDGVLVTENRHVEGIVTRGSIMRWLQTHTRLAPGQA